VREFNRVRTRGAAGKPDTFAPATWRLLEKQVQKDGSFKWVEIDSGLVSIGVIPLVPFFTGRRTCGSWRVRPALRDVADLQIKHYQGETNLECAKDRSCFPMLAGNGVNPPTEVKADRVDNLDKTKNQSPSPAPAIIVAPGAALFAPMDSNGNHGEWEILEPQATSLQFLSGDLQAMAKEIRELGRQPLTANSGNLTVVTTQFAAQKGNSAVQAWAWGLKDALEQAFVYTCLWLKLSEKPDVKVHTDFAIEVEAADVPKTLLEMRKAREITQETHWAEQKRRGVLSSDFDPAAEKVGLLAEAPDPDTEDEVRGSLTPPRRAAA
jgi:hypothetical protein